MGPKLPRSRGHWFCLLFFCLIPQPSFLHSFVLSSPSLRLSVSLIFCFFSPLFFFSLSLYLSISFSIYIYAVGGESWPKKGVSKGESGHQALSGFPSARFALVLEGFRARSVVLQNSANFVCVLFLRFFEALQKTQKVFLPQIRSKRSVFCCFGLCMRKIWHRKKGGFSYNFGGVFSFVFGGLALITKPLVL